MANNPRRCIIVGNILTGICNYVNGANPKCNEGDPTMTTNIVMANWSKSMWQGVVDRAVRMLASGPFASHFFSASATVDGN
ncbi:hypothetical protein KIN20_012030 [Parelaphostrongylus tenuis]|uniref:Uncharacterized protein n=1 Tax=Parelaphostrongylus tenuis TaxID=148309 RepID=A0AAD5MEU9_PARTN|nr:hypothetical protein KIN20_012030 [Parelaphostrongylus tenuis]